MNGMEGNPVEQAPFFSDSVALLPEDCPFVGEGGFIPPDSRYPPVLDGRTTLSPNTSYPPVLDGKTTIFPNSCYPPVFNGKTTVPPNNCYPPMFNGKTTVPPNNCYPPMFNGKTTLPPNICYPPAFGGMTTLPPGCCYPPMFLVGPTPPPPGWYPSFENLGLTSPKECPTQTVDKINASNKSLLVVGEPINPDEWPYNVKEEDICLEECPTTFKDKPISIASLRSSSSISSKKSLAEKQSSSFQDIVSPLSKSTSSIHEITKLAPNACRSCLRCHPHICTDPETESESSSSNEWLSREKKFTKSRLFKISTPMPVYFVARKPTKKTRDISYYRRECTPRKPFKTAVKREKSKYATKDGIPKMLARKTLVKCCFTQNKYSY